MSGAMPMITSANWLVLLTVALCASSLSQSAVSAGEVQQSAIVHQQLPSLETEDELLKTKFQLQQFLPRGVEERYPGSSPRARRAA